MVRDILVQALSSGIDEVLARDLVDNFLAMRQDVATNTLGRAAPGKFVETVVQVLQNLETGRYQAKPRVDDYLRKIESTTSSVDDGLRICASRIARAMYTLRNKRNIAHKGDVDPNKYDLGFLYSAAQWIMAELIRNVSGLPMEQAGKLVAFVQAPVGGLVQDFGDKKLVLADMTTREEVLVLLHSQYPDALPTDGIASSVDRRNRKTVLRNLGLLWRFKLVEGSTESGYQLTERGYQVAAEIVRRHLSN